MSNTTFIRRKIEPIYQRESDQNTWTQKSFHNRPVPFGVIVTIFCFGSARLSLRSARVARSSRFHCSWWD